MVKNKKGGRNHKKMASKGAKNHQHTAKLRLPGQEGEMIARVMKTYGHGMLEVLCNDGVTRLCIIRKKFRGRNRRDNDTRIHSFILVGIRAFEVVAAGKKEKCDLIYVYNDSQKLKIKQGGHVAARLLQDKGDHAEDGGFIFSKDAPEPAPESLNSILEPSDAPAAEANAAEDDWFAEMIDDI